VVALLVARHASKRIGLLVRHNAIATRFGSRYWVFVAAGLFEPLFYLLTFGIGIGSLVERTIPYQGAAVGYSEFVAPGLLAVSAMSSVLGLAVFGFFAKLKHSRVFEVIAATPVRPVEIAIGELVWALSRSVLFNTLFLAIMVALGLTTPGWALPALIAATLASAAFGAVGMAVTTFIRGWQDFDMVVMAQTAMLLFSGTFFPNQSYPAVLRVIVTATPLYQSIELLRGICLGRLGADQLISCGYLVVLTLVGLFLARRRIERHLRR
jgi:Nod factor-specific ABC transporter NodJ protein